MLRSSTATDYLGLTAEAALQRCQPTVSVVAAGGADRVPGGTIRPTGGHAVSTGATRCCRPRTLGCLCNRHATPLITVSSESISLDEFVRDADAGARAKRRVGADASGRLQAFAATTAKRSSAGYCHSTLECFRPCDGEASTRPTWRENSTRLLASLRSLCHRAMRPRW